MPKVRPGDRLRSCVCTTEVIVVRVPDGARRVELLCVKAGVGPLTVNGDLLTPQTAKPLPASD